MPEGNRSYGGCAHQSSNPRPMNAMSFYLSNQTRTAQSQHAKRHRNQFGYHQSQRCQHWHQVVQMIDETSMLIPVIDSIAAFWRGSVKRKPSSRVSSRPSSSFLYSSHWEVFLIPIIIIILVSCTLGLVRPSQQFLIWQYFDYVFKLSFVLCINSTSRLKELYLIVSPDAKSWDRPWG